MSMPEGRNLVVADRLAMIPAFAMDEGELISTLSESVYPGAKPVSIKLVVNYCKANLLDPFQKPVHIVPMSRKTDRKDGQGKPIYEDVDTIMPGIGLYRIQAARTGEYGGISHPEFGPMVTLKFSEDVWEDNKKTRREASIEYPEWCKVTVRRVIAGRLVDFDAIEYWIENYAPQSRYTFAPNAMWKKRPRGQLAKCAEAQALRKGFPETGSAPTAEEMEGKWIDHDGEAAPPPAPRAPVQSKSEAAKANVIDVDTDTGEVTKPVAATAPAKQDAPASPPAPAGMLKLIRAKAAAIAVDEPALLKAHKIAALDGITVEVGNAILKSIAAGPDAYAEAATA